MSIETLSPPPPGGRRLPSRRAWAGLLLVIALTTAVRLRLATAPLERDEGEYAYNAQLLLRHQPPYRHAYNLKFPGVYGMYAIILATLGQTPRAIRTGVAMVNAADTLLVFLLARRLWGKRSATCGVAAAATFALLSMDEHSLGWVGHAEHFMLLPALGGWLLLLPTEESGRHRPGIARVGLAGLLLGLAILMKQPAAAFALAGAGLLVWRWWADGPPPLRWRSLILQVLVLGCAVAGPTAGLCLLLWRAGVLDRFWFWTVDYARFYAGQVPLRAVPVVLGYSVRDLVASSWPLWGLALMGFGAAWARPWVGPGAAPAAAPGAAPARRRAAGLTIILAGSLVGTSAGLLFRNHYFILLMPAAALAVGGLWRGDADPPWYRGATTLLFVAACGYFALAERRFLLTMTPAAACRDMYGGEAFAQAPDVGRYLRSHTLPTETIAVLGSEPEIYFYAQRMSATGYIYTYPLLEPQPFALGMQQQMAREIEAARPVYVVWVEIDNSWTQPQDVDPPRFIFDWWTTYRRQYELEARWNLADAPAEQGLAAQMPFASPGSAYPPTKAMLIYRRRPLP